SLAIDNMGTDPAASGSETQQRTPYVLDLGKAGEADCGRGVDEAFGVTSALESSGIPCCVVGAKALVYYGAHRVPMVSTRLLAPLALQDTEQTGRTGRFASR